MLWGEKRCGLFPLRDDQREFRSRHDRFSASYFKLDASRRADTAARHDSASDTVFGAVDKLDIVGSEIKQAFAVRSFAFEMPKRLDRRATIRRCLMLNVQCELDSPMKL